MYVEMLQDIVKANEELGRTFEELGVAVTEFNDRIDEAARKTVEAINRLPDEA